MKDRVFYDHSDRLHQPGGLNWRDYRRAQQRLPGDVAHWLLDRGSLTQRLQLSGGAFSVHLCSQDWGLPQLNERILLHLAHRELAQLRETELRIDGAPWVFARSIIPADSLRGANRRLRYLGTRSLGSWLFQNPDLRRSHFQIARIAPGAGLVPPALQRGQTLWGRRSRFEVGGAALLVCEIFLPDFRPWPAAAPPVRPVI